MCICHRPFLDGSSEANFLEDLAEDDLQLNMALWPDAYMLMESSCRPSLSKIGSSSNQTCHRSFLDGSSEANFLEDLAEDELQLNLALWPCAWMLMEPSRKGPSFQTPHRLIAVPIRIDQAGSRLPLNVLVHVLRSCSRVPGSDYCSAHPTWLAPPFRS